MLTAVILLFLFIWQYRKRSTYGRQSVLSYEFSGYNAVGHVIKLLKSRTYKKRS